MIIRQARITSTKGSSVRDDPVQRDPRHRAGGEQVDAEGRRDHAQRQIDHHDQAEVHRIDAEMHRHRRQDRRQHDDRGARSR